MYLDFCSPFWLISILICVFSMSRTHRHIPWFPKRKVLRRIRRKLKVKISRWEIIDWVVFISVICILYTLICCCFHLPDGSGEFGDQFGALTAWFTGVAFALMVITMRLQKRELELTRETVLASKDEMAASRHAFEEQALAYEKKQTTDLITSLLNQYQQIKNNLSFKDDKRGNVLHGSEVLRHIASINKDDKISLGSRHDLIIGYARDANLEGCCSVLLIILRTILTSNLNEEEKKHQKEIIKNILTKEEKLIFQLFFFDYESPLFKEFKKDEGMRNEVDNVFMVN